MLTKIVLSIFADMKRQEHEQLTINQILERYWGYTSFRPQQREIIESVLSGVDTLALLPTGGGKSLTYQIPALAREGVCIVVTPLIALMKDQVDQLRKLGISAIAIHSGMSRRQIDIALDNCVYGDVKFLYVSPERIATELFRYRVERMNVSLIAIDEAHCISQWGYDFRPAYLRIAELREHTDSAPILALTASATKVVVSDIMERLKFNSKEVIIGSFARPNLSYAVREVEDKDAQLMKIISSVAGSGIVYVRSREGAEKLAMQLQNSGISASFYHAGLPHTERSIRQDEWIDNKVRIMVATNAFGMGINKPDVRFVVHYTMCDSLESYYQEAGRAGRDGLRSYAVLLVAPDDDARIVKRFEAEFPPIEKVKEIYDRICSYLQIAIGDGAMTSHIFNIYEFCGHESLSRNMVLSAIKILEGNNYLMLTDEMENPARIMFTVGRDDLYKVRVDHLDLDHFLRVILRLYEGLFSDFRRISEIEIAHWSGYTVDRVKDLLKRLWQMRLIRYIPSNKSPLIYLNEERTAIRDIYISPDSYKFRREIYLKRYESMLLYATNTTSCRSIAFEEYFGANPSGECGVCDICLEKKRAQKNTALDIEEIIINSLRDKPQSIKELLATLKTPHEKGIEIITRLIDDGKIVENKDSKLSARA